MKYVLLASAPLLVAGDLPVHCVRTQTQGEWKFHLGKPSSHRTTCGHKTPDIDKEQPSLAKFETAKSLSLQLSDPNHAKIDGEDATWTMIYDEGISVKSEKYDFFSFSHFNIPSTPTVHSKKLFQSFCGQTEVGWYQDKTTGEYGCWKGEKVTNPNVAFYHLSLLEEEKIGRRTTKKTEEDLAASTRSFLAAFDQAEKRENVEEGAFSRSLDHQEIVRKINREQQSWTAAVYSDDFIAQKMGQLQKRALNKMRLPLHEKENRSPRKNTVAEGAKIKELPANFNWNDVNGTSWIEPVLDQQDCGSCYAVSSVHMLSSRYRVLKQDPKLEGFSVNFPLYCSDLNQGCNGGYPSLVSMWSHHVGLVPKSCTGPYFTSSAATCKSSLTNHVKQQDFEKCVHKAETEKTLASVTNWNYIGGYYGGCNVAGMMTDLFQHGPMAVALEPGMDFMYYKSGVYKSTPVATNVNWVKVDHAVLLIGWGEDNGTPYWVIQNSWGNEWGENGNIRIIRGDNESGVEFQAVAAYLADGKAKPILEYTRNIMDV